MRDRRLRQGSYAWPVQMGMQGSFVDFWTQSVIGQEGEAHKRLRTLAVPVLGPDYIASLEPGFTKIAQDLTDRMVKSGTVEFMSDFSAEFSGRVTCLLLNIDHGDWRSVSGDASTLGLAMGTEAKTHESQINAACDRLFELARDLIRRARDGADDGGYVQRLVARAAELGNITDHALENLVVISIFGGVDTTRSQLGHLVHLFILNPDQWDLLRADPDLAPACVEEAIRHHPTTTWSTREAIETFEHNGVEIRQGQTVHVLVHASAMDPAVTDGTNFDITARRKIHFGFGGGAHNCLGQAIARADIAACLRVMAARVAKFEADGQARWLPDSGNTSPAHLPVRVLPA